MKSTTSLVFLITMVISLLTGCSGGTLPVSTPEIQIPTVTRISIIDTAFVASATITTTPPATPSPTATRTEPPTGTPTDEPTLTPTITETATLEPATSSNTGILLYYAISSESETEDCGTLVPVSSGLLPTGDVVQDVKTALNRLFATGTQYVGNLYNPSYQSKLRVAKVEYKKSNSMITVYLTGSFTKPKDNCGKSLYRAQVWNTARQFPGISRAEIWVNQYLLGDLLVATNQ